MMQRRKLLQSVFVGAAGGSSFGSLLLSSSLSEAKDDIREVGQTWMTVLFTR